LNLSYQFIEAEQKPLLVFCPTFQPITAGAMQLQDLPMEESCVDIHLSVRAVVKLLQQHPDWPGVILTDQDQFVGMLTRSAFSEFSNSSFWIGIFSKETILTFYEKHPSRSLVLDGSISVQLAIRAVLNRESKLIYDPIVVCLGENQYRLLDTPALLQLQSSLLVNPSCEFQQLLFRNS